MDRETTYNSLSLQHQRDVSVDLIHLLFARVNTTGRGGSEELAIVSTLFCTVQEPFSQQHASIISDGYDSWMSILGNAPSVSRSKCMDSDKSKKNLYSTSSPSFSGRYPGRRQRHGSDFRVPERPQSCSRYLQAALAMWIGARDLRISRHPVILVAGPLLRCKER